MAASVDSLNNRFLGGSCDNNQEGLLSILRAAEDLPTSASPLVCPLIPRIPSPSLDLIENIVNIFYKANKPKQALNYLAVQIKASQQQQHNHSNGLNEPSFTFLYFKKLHVARKYYYLSNRHITALQALLPILENRFGVTDVQTLEIKRELSLALFDSGDKEQARLSYREAVVMLEEKKEVGKSQDKEKDGVDDVGSGGGDRRGCLPVTIKSTLQEWDRRLVEREEVDKKRAALLLT